MRCATSSVVICRQLCRPHGIPLGVMKRGRGYDSLRVTMYAAAKSYRERKKVVAAMAASEPRCVQQRCRLLVSRAPGGQQQEASSAGTVEPVRYDDRRSVTSRAAGDDCVSAAMCVARVVPRGWSSVDSRCPLCRLIPLCRV